MVAAPISSSIGARNAHLWLSVERGNWHLLTKLSIECLAMCLRYMKKRYLHQQSKPPTVDLSTPLKLRTSLNGCTLSADCVIVGTGAAVRCDF